MERFVVIYSFLIFNAVSAQNNHILLAVTASRQHVISVVDLQDPESNCESIYLDPIAHLPDLMTTTASFVNGELLVCGAPSDECYYYNDSSDSWRDGPERSVYRFLPFGIDLTNGYHWLSGGRNEHGDYYDDSEVYDGESYSDGIVLPLNVSDHCVVDLGGDEVMLIGGLHNPGEVYTINVITGEYSIIGYLPAEDDLTLPACGLATKSDGSKVVVIAGGSFNANDGITNSYIYDFEQSIFLPGPPLPEPRTWGRAVQYGNSFIIVGGADSGYYDSVAYEDMLFYHPDDESWEVLPQKLPYPDYVTAALLVPDDFIVNC